MGLSKMLSRFLRPISKLNSNKLLVFLQEQAIAGSGQYFFVAERKLAVVVVLMNGCLTVLVMTCMLLEALHNTRAALNWSFWICAFANNQCPGVKWPV